MRQIAKLAMAAAAVCAGITATAAQAQCWSKTAIDAAQVRDLETMLMVASLRCRITGQDFLSEYNAFVRQSRPALVEANDALRTHFASNGGLNAYDRYVTGVANRYGGGADGLTCRDMRSILSAAKAAGDNYSELVRLAQDADMKPQINGGACSVTIATRK